MTSPSNTAWARDAVDKVLSEFLSYDGSLRLSEAGIANLRTDLVSAFLAAERRAKEECARIAQGDKAGHADCGHEEGYWDGRTDAAIAIRATIELEPRTGTYRVDR